MHAPSIAVGTLAALLMAPSACAGVGSSFWVYYDRPQCASWPPQIAESPDRTLKPIKWADQPVHVRVVDTVTGARGAPFFVVEVDGQRRGFVWAPLLPAPKTTSNQFTLRESCVLAESPVEVSAALAARSNKLSADERAAVDQVAIAVREQSLRDLAASRLQEQISGMSEPRLGMTCAEARSGTNWGKPRRINWIENALGFTEQLVFDNSRYMYCTNGTVSEIQQF